MQNYYNNEDIPVIIYNQRVPESMPTIFDENQ